MNYKKVIIFEYEKQIRMTANDDKDKRTKNMINQILLLCIGILFIYLILCNNIKLHET